MRTIRRLALAAAMALLAISASRAAEPTLRRVLLSTGGVGYFGFEAAPDAEGRVRLTVPLAQVDDILKSLTVLGGDGTVRGGEPAGTDATGRPVPGRPFGEQRPGRPPDPAAAPARGRDRGARGRRKCAAGFSTVAREEVVEGERATVAPPAQLWPRPTASGP